MRGIADETVGPFFNLDLLQSARDKTLQVIQETARQIRAGHTEKDARTLLQSLQSELGAPKSWHPPQIRFGKNTLLAFGQKGEDDVPLKENDIFFLDIGPLFESHEGDVGRTFAVGDDVDMLRCAQDVEKIWFLVRAEWRRSQATGRELYAYAEHCAKNLGWTLALQQANGHRIADFPHAAKQRGSIEHFEQYPQANRWILEIQIRHPVKDFGAFYEDLLN